LGREKWAIFVADRRGRQQEIESQKNITEKHYYYATTELATQLLSAELTFFSNVVF